ncbi:MAG: sensor histidine kinase [Deltaproteobacteria bacterium]|nr:sensor histidine kinase [Deltaproteobacteria bacterium]
MTQRKVAVLAHDDTDVDVAEAVRALQREGFAVEIVAVHDDATAKLVLRAQESEARRIARDLHDRLGQQLLAMLRALEESRYGDARTLAEEAVRTTREVSTELWPAVLDDLGLASALRWLADRYRDRLGRSVRVHAEDLTGIPREVETACYRITQEALTNAARHAGAQLVTVRLRSTASGIELVVDDDGRGFDVEAARKRAVAGESLGLLAMRERATLAGGSFALTSRPGGGTSIRASFKTTHASDPDRR